MASGDVHTYSVSNLNSWATGTNPNRMATNTMKMGIVTNAYSTHCIYGRPMLGAGGTTNFAT